MSKRKPRRRQRDRERSVPPERLLRVYRESTQELLARFEDEHGRSPHSVDELIEWVRSHAQVTQIYARGKRLVISKGTFDKLMTSAVVTAEARCGHQKGEHDECRRWVGFMLHQGITSTGAYAYRWWGFRRGHYVDAPTGRHNPVIHGDLPGWQDVYPTRDEMLPVLEGFCQDHGPRYGDAQPLLDLAMRDSKRVTGDPAPERPASFAFSDHPPSNVEQAIT